jgi:catalase
MAMMNPKGRANYEPNSWGGGAGGPRECHETGFRSFPAKEAGPKIRERSASFADHYSQARQFYISQTKIEQGHIANAIVFELSKVQRADIRTRVVSHLPNIDAKLADRVAKGLGFAEKVRAASPAAEPRKDLKASRTLSIALNPPKTFAGRKVGALVTDGVDLELLAAIQTALQNEGAMLEIVAPTIGGVETSDGTRVGADQKIGGGPSVLYDAVVVLPSKEGVKLLVKNPAAREFVADAFSHLKFIGFVEAAMPLFAKAGIAEDLDAGCIELNAGKGAEAFVSACRKLRVWEREQTIGV